MKMTRTRMAWVVLIGIALLCGVQPAPEVEATFMTNMVWTATANWLGCNQQGSSPECADYGTPTGGTVMLTCCVSTEALGTSDMSACEEGVTRSGRGEL